MRLTYTCRRCGGEFLVHHCADAEMTRLRRELAEEKQIAEVAVAMVQVAREELAECKAKLAEQSMDYNMQPSK